MTPQLEDEAAGGEPVTAPRTVAVVGTVNRDHIVDAAGGHSVSLGGILYNTLVLGALLDGTP